MILKCSSDYGVLDWKKVSASNEIDYAFIRTSKGLEVDSQLEFNVSSASDNNVKTSFYHEVVMSSTDVKIDAIDQAKLFSELLCKYMHNEHCPFVLRIDENLFKLNSIQVNMWIDVFIKELKRSHFYNIAIHSNASFLNMNLPHNHNLGNIPVWLIGEQDSLLPNGWKQAWMYQQKDGTIVLANEK